MLNMERFKEQYSIGEGQTNTTVEKPLSGVTAGTSSLIKSTVIDLSPGNPNTPAISDEEMAEWMDYLMGKTRSSLTHQR